MQARRSALFELHGGLSCVYGVAVVQWHPMAFDGSHAGSFGRTCNRTTQPYTFENVVIQTIEQSHRFLA